MSRSYFVPINRATTRSSIWVASMVGRLLTVFTNQEKIKIRTLRTVGWGTRPRGWLKAAALDVLHATQAHCKLRIQNSPPFQNPNPKGWGTVVFQRCDKR